MDPLSGHLDRYLVCNRARHDLDSSNSKRLNLNQNEPISDCVYDSGVGRLEIDSKFDLDVERKRKKIKPTPNEVEKVTVLEASPPKDALHNVSLDELKRRKQLNYCCYEDKNYFDFLSDEVILYVFRKLPIEQLIKVVQVCKRFHQICEDETLWTSIDLSHQRLKSGSIGSIMSRQVINLKLERSRILSPSILLNVKAAFPDFDCRLKYLDLTKAIVFPQTIVAILIKCKRLRKLTLEGIPINDSVLDAVSLNCDIEVLNLAHCKGMTVKGFTCLLKYCREIRELNLSWTNVNSDCVDFICDNLPSTLHKFNFSGNQLRDENVDRLVSNCPHLRELDLTYCHSITGYAVNKLKELTHLPWTSFVIASRTMLLLRNAMNLMGSCRRD